MTNTSETSLRDELIERLLAAVGAEDKAGDPEYRVDAGQVADELLPVFVAELRRLADELDVTRQNCTVTPFMQDYASGLGEGVRRLRARADELDGGAR